MPRYEIRWAVHHPLRWLRYWWLHLAVAGVVAGLAVTWTSDIFDRIMQPELWPLAAAGVAAMILSTAFAPRAATLLAITAAATVTLGVLRALALLEVAWREPQVAPLALSLACDGLVLAALGIVWPSWTEDRAEEATLRSGADGLRARSPCG